uniref:Glycosyl transferase, group 1 n=1 Tax=Dechloromonas aromatica (strain RCB) TaxID=159087 RepID=Q47GL4_DECAR
MKMLHVSQYFWHESFQINSIVARLVRNGHQVDVLTGKPNYPQGRIYPGYRAWGCCTELHHGATIHRIPLAPRKTGAVRLAVNYLSFVVSGLLFGPWMLRRYQPDVIFVYAPSPLLQALPAIWLAKLKRRKLVHWVQDIWPESLSATGHVKNRIVLGLVERLVRYIYRKTDLILVQSPAFDVPMRRLALGREIAYQPNSVDDSFAVRPAQQGEMSNQFTVMFAGNLGTAQAVECILAAAEALREHSDICIMLVGDGSRRPWLLEEVARRRLGNIMLPGRFPPSDMPEMMARASALLVTLAAQEIFEYTVPSKVQAYIAAGPPVIAALNGEGARIVRESGCGLAVPAEDTDALAAAILRLRDMDPVERQAMGDAGHAWYQAHYREDMLVENLLGYLNGAAQYKEECE